VPDRGAQAGLYRRGSGAFSRHFNLCGQSSGQPGGIAGEWAIYKYVVLEPALKLVSAKLALLFSTLMSSTVGPLVFAVRWTVSEPEEEDIIRIRIISYNNGSILHNYIK
jgi:hypothetical protein